MKFLILVRHEIEIPATLVEEIFNSVCEDFLDGKTTEPVHFEDILYRANYRHGIALPKWFRFDEGANNKITLSQIKAAKRSEVKRKADNR